MASSSQYILLNGNFHNETNTIINIFNRALRYGDCITETIHACASRLCFFDEHLENLRQAMKAAYMKVPAKFLNDNKEFQTEISKMLTKNRTFKGATVKITVFRSSFATGTKVPDNVEYIAYIDGLFENSLVYELNAQGLSVDVFKDYPKPCGMMSAYDTHESMMCRMMACKKCGTLLSDMILVNPGGSIIESASHGNLFIMKDNVLCTPPIKDGCVNDVMRTKVIEAARQLGMATDTEHSISEDDLKIAGELFLASTAGGIKWVIAYKGRRFRHTAAENILKAVNESYSREE